MPVKLHYGVPTHRSGVNVRFGIEKGFFAEEGMDVVVREIFGGPEISAAYDSGELKIGELGTPPGITAIGRGQRFRIIGSGLPRGVGLFFIVRTDVRNWEDLRGRPLGALSIGSCSYWYLRQMLIQNGTRSGSRRRHQGSRRRLCAATRATGKRRDRRTAVD